jgi:peptidyl-tRNA hydrolase, PTH2 family
MINFLPQNYFELSFIILVSSVGGYFLLSYFFSKKINFQEKPEKQEKVEIFEKIKEPLKMVLLVRKDLKMEIGKIASQCSHATLGVFRKIQKSNNSIHSHYVKEWLRIGQKKIALRIPDLETL